MSQKLLVVFSTLTPTKGIILGVITLITPIKPIMFGVLILIFSDTLTGIMASYKRNKIKFRILSWASWKHITSNRLGDSITKSLVYMILIICGFVIDKTILLNDVDLWFTKFLAGAVALREIKSLIENGEDILGGGLITTIKLFLKGGIKGGMEDMFKDKEK